MLASALPPGATSAASVSTSYALRISILIAPGKMPGKGGVEGLKEAI